MRTPIAAADRSGRRAGEALSREGQAIGGARAADLDHRGASAGDAGRDGGSSDTAWMQASKLTVGPGESGEGSRICRHSGQWEASCDACRDGDAVGTLPVGPVCGTVTPDPGWPRLTSRPCTTGNAAGVTRSASAAISPDEKEQRRGMWTSRWRVERNDPLLAQSTSAFARRRRRPRPRAAHRRLPRDCPAVPRDRRGDDALRRGVRPGVRGVGKRRCRPRVAASRSLATPHGR